MAEKFEVQNGGLVSDEMNAADQQLSYNLYRVSAYSVKDGSMQPWVYVLAATPNDAVCQACCVNRMLYSHPNKSFDECKELVLKYSTVVKVPFLIRGWGEIFF